MKLFTDKAILGVMCLGLSLSGGLLCPSYARAESTTGTPIETVAEVPEITEESLGETPEVAPTAQPGMDGEMMTEDMSEAEDESAMAETPEAAEESAPAQPETSPPAASEPEAPKPKNKKGLKILFGILQLLGNELTQ